MDYIEIYKAYTRVIFITTSSGRIFCSLINQYPRLQLAKNENQYFSEKERKREEGDRWLKFDDLKETISKYIWRLIPSLDLRVFNILLAKIDLTLAVVEATNMHCDSRTERLSFGAFNFRWLSLARGRVHPLHAASICRKSLFPSSCRARQRETNIRSIFHLSP